MTAIRQDGGFHLPACRREAGRDPLGPFDDHVPRRLRQVPDQQVVEGLRKRQPIGVDVEDVAAALVDVEQGEGGAGDVARDAQSAGQAAHEGRLARPEVALERQDGVRRQQGRERLGRPLGLFTRTGDVWMEEQRIGMWDIDTTENESNSATESR